ncbi:NAD-dependent epimerase/dehydratase family protein [Photobacterium damselae]|uniref:NAD-dependent epimerase/dehydratase family protein n=1 Tax=Photobacterium damselae TaxID=38293 RepID=UPI003B66D288
MNVLLLGGTGAMGVHLTEILAENGHNVYVTSRSKKKDSEKVKYIHGNAHDEEFFSELLGSYWDVIVDFMVYNTSGFQSRIDDLLKSTNQYIYLSSARVYADSEKPIIESSPRLLDKITDNAYLNTDEYALSKARQENILFRSGKSNWTIIRPYITYSESRLQLGVLEKEDWLYRACNYRPINFSKNILSKCTTLTYGYDVALGIAAIVGVNRAFGEAFHITSPYTIYWQEVLNVYKSVLKEKLGVKVQCHLEDNDDFVNHHKNKYQIEFDRLYNRKFDNTKISKFINVNTFRRPEEGLIECLHEFLKSPCFLSINWEKEAIKDKNASVYTNPLEISGLKNKAKYIYYRFNGKTK